jgi:hypothetical protein
MCDSQKKTDTAINGITGKLKKKKRKKEKCIEKVNSLKVNTFYCHYTTLIKQQFPLPHHSVNTVDNKRLNHN